MNVYVVQGSCGEYSDHSEWLVAAFTDEEEAKAFVVACTEAGNAKVAAHGDKSYWSIPSGTDLDPNWDVDYSGFNYTYFTVPLRGKL